MGSEEYKLILQDKHLTDWSHLLSSSACVHMCVYVSVCVCVFNIQNSMYEVVSHRGFVLPIIICILLMTNGIEHFSGT